MSSLPESLQTWWKQHREDSVEKITPLSGGSICQVSRITTSSGENLVLKTHHNAPSNMFPAEAAGLQAIDSTHTVPCPSVFFVDTDCLLMKYLPPGDTTSDCWQLFARRLADMHRIQQPFFGFDTDNFCGLNPQKNTQEKNGFAFFAKHRLIFQGNMALDNGYLNNREFSDLEALCQRLPDLLPAQHASLLHGDLWSGNYLVTSGGDIAVIDPACYYGFREADIAMTQLFGGYPENFYQAYQDYYPMEAGWRERMELYNLYHMLNHLNLFGGQYHGGVCRILNRYK
jgi:fructosamine-3-kinase